jgi:transposase
LVFDKGNNSQDNLDTVEAAPFHFVGSLVPTQHPELLKIERSAMRPLDADGLPGVKSWRTTKKVFGHDRTVLVTYNDNLFVAQARTLLREISKRQQHLRRLQAKLDTYRSGGRRGRPLTVAGVRKKASGWLAARHMKDLFEVEISERAGLPHLSYHFAEEAWSDLQKTLLGKTILFTDNDTWSDAEIIRAYRSQHEIEAAFHDMKDPHHIALRPQHHWTDQKIRVHVFMCVLALMLLSLLRRELARHDIHCSIRRMLTLLSGIKEIVMAFPSATGALQPVLRTSLCSMSDEERRIYEALDLGRYVTS